MRCPICANRQGANRDGMRCRRCGYAFVFNPKLGMRLADRRVIAAAQRLGRKGAAYAPRQVLGSLAAERRFVRWTFPASSAHLNAALVDLERLRVLHATAFRSMLTGPALEAAGTQQWPEPDIFDYGAERILVVDEPLAVDLLVDAGVHVGARAIIVDQQGYPARIVALARELVIARPDVPVMVLHASGTQSEAAVAAARRLVGTKAPVTDVGLSSDAAKRHRALRWARRLPSVPLDALPRWMLGTAAIGALTSDPALSIDQVLAKLRRTVLIADDYRSLETSDGDYG